MELSTVMPAGPHVFGDGRLGLWTIANSSFTDKLKHILPRVRPLGVTDIFLPRSATPADVKLVKDSGYFAALYETPPGGMSAAKYAQQALSDLTMLNLSVLELNIEGVPDIDLSDFCEQVVAMIRTPRPNLRLRLNVVPYKGSYLPRELLATDPQLYVIVQNYLGNMQTRVAEDEIVRDVVERGIPWSKVSVMYGAYVGVPRVKALPQIRTRGSLYSDDLLADAGYLG